jgi:hypothetical protein
MTGRRTTRAGVVGLAMFLYACVPHLRTAPGREVQQPLPPAVLSAGSHLVVLQWELNDVDFVARGDAAARLSAPDSARLDFFLAGGLGRGAVILVGDSLVFPPYADDFGRRLVPPPPLLWASLGRLALPPATDTTIHVNGDTLRADFGTPVSWRATFVRDSLWRVERVARERVLEWVQRNGATVRYRNESERRQLDLKVTRTESVGAFDPWIWSFP